MKTVTLLLLACLGLAGCATPRMDDAGRLALYQAHAGVPVPQFRYFGNAMGWERIDDQHVLLQMRPREAWLLRISGPCLDWGGASPTLGLSSRNGLVVARFDRVVVHGSPVDCRIEEIRPVDMEALRAASRAQPSGT